MNKEQREEIITVSMTKQRYLTLLKAELKLDMLEMGGVDNWEWYGEALNPDDETSYGDQVEDFEEMVKVL